MYFLFIYKTKQHLICTIKRYIFDIQSVTRYFQPVRKQQINKLEWSIIQNLHNQNSITVQSLHFIIQSISQLLYKYSDVHRNNK